MQDLKILMPHSKPESKMERKDDLFVVNEVSLKFVNMHNRCE
jgi:ribosome biogenesis protein BRX1